MPVKKLRTKKTNKFLEFFNPKTLRGGIALFMLVFVIAGAAFLIYRSFAGTGGAGAFHTCWVKESDKTLWCWGDNSKGQLGQGNTTNLLVPTQVKNIDSVAQVSSGGNHTCARKIDNTLWCWGENRFGQLGVGDTEISTCGGIPCAKGPRQVLDPTSTTSDAKPFESTSWVSAGNYHTCARKTDGSAWCWGSNYRGQLGIGRDSSGKQYGDQKLPKKLAITDVLGVYAGGNHTCATINTTADNTPSDTTVSCWGSNNNGQLGIGSEATTTCGTGLYMGPCALSPRTVPGATAGSKFDNTRSVSAGALHTCAVKNGGALWCWGSNQYGQLGIGNTTNSNTPIKVNIDNAYQVSSGQYHTCARKDDANSKVANLWCWGYNASGQLGRGNRTNAWRPTQVQGGFIAKAISAGAWSTCASKFDYSLWCWGDNSKGQLGIGNLIDQLLPKELDFSWK